MNGVLEMKNNMYAMLLEFEEINSTLNKYLNNLESEDDGELVPRQIKVDSGGIKPPNPNPKIVTFDKEPNGIYNTGGMSGFGALEDTKYFISIGENSNNFCHSQHQHHVSNWKNETFTQIEGPNRRSGYITRITLYTA